MIIDNENEAVKMNLKPLVSKKEYLSQMESGALLNPRIDSTFKALFTQPTKESRNALHSFLEAATALEISRISFAANDAPSAFFGQRGVSYDILCQLDDGTQVDIEMQAFEQNYDYGKRAEYQAARLETTYLKKGEDWEKSPIVFQITVLDFPYGGKDGKTVSRYEMRSENGDKLSGSLNIVFINLTKTKELEKTLDKNSKLENWAVFLKNADNPEKQDMIKKLTNKETGLMEAKKSLSSISADQDLWIAQYRQEIYERDRLSDLAGAKRKAISEGLEQGLKQGIEQGIQQGIQQGAAQQKAEDEKQINHLFSENARLQKEIQKLKSMLSNR